MQNEHLIPQMILDLGSKIIDPSIRYNEKQNYLHRIETLKKYCENILEQYNNQENKKTVFKR